MSTRLTTSTWVIIHEGSTFVRYSRAAETML